jgi:hypothetical protein
VILQLELGGALRDMVAPDQNEDRNQKQNPPQNRPHFERQPSLRSKIFPPRAPRGSAAARARFAGP